jgi:Putative zinc-finger
MAARKTTVKALTNKTCKQIADLVCNYLNDTLAPRVKRDFNQHLTICPDCVAFLNTYKKTVATTRSIRAGDMPENVRNNILDFLRSRARQNRTSG